MSEEQRLRKAIERLARGTPPRPFTPGSQRTRGLSADEKRLDAMQMYAQHILDGGDPDPPNGYKDNGRPTLHALAWKI